MPKKKRKVEKVAIQSDTDSDDNDFTVPKKKGNKFAISDSDDEEDVFPKASTLKGKFPFWLSLGLSVAISRIFTNM